MSDFLPLAELPRPRRAELPSAEPPPRFEGATFRRYRPQHPSQQAALGVLQAFLTETARPPQRHRWPWRRKREGRGVYLDGGFGVGKTHLLAASFHAFAAGSKAYLSFTELVYAIGALGMEDAVERYGRTDLLCIDEFELDDPGNTLMVKSFLQSHFTAGGHVVTTSNTPPAAQGQGRFNAEDFRREIQSIADRFDIVEVAGGDYRRRERPARLLDERELDLLLKRAEEPAPRVLGSFDELLELLREVHPVRYGALLESFGSLYLREVRTIEGQADALRFVHFVDKLYDARKVFRAAGKLPLAELFAPVYRNGAYAKKHERCLSRIAELLEEAPTTTVAAAEVATPSD